MMSLFDKFRHDPKFKNETAETGILPTDLIQRDGLRGFEKRFLLKKLLKCRRFFKKYLKDNGEHAPVNTAYGWINEAANYTLSFTHFVPTNQKYARQVLECIDQAKINSINCDILLALEIPCVEKFESLKIHSNAAYIRVNTKNEEKLFYVNKGKKTCTELKVNVEQIQLFDKCMNPNYDIRQLNDSQLKTLQSIIKHEHPKDEYFAVFNALKNIKKIHSKMVNRRIFGRIRRGLEETLAEFQLPIDCKEFEIEKEKIESIFAYRFEININVRIISPILSLMNKY